MIHKKANAKLVIIIAIVAILGFLVVNLFFIKSHPERNVYNQSNQNSANNYLEKTGGLLKFRSYSEFKNFLRPSSTSTQQYSSGKLLGDFEGGVMAATSAKETGESNYAARYSKTNVQVEGVDEPDIVKNDGKYIYTLSGNAIKIIEAYPAENMKVVGEIKYENNIIDYDKPYSMRYIKNIFLNDDKLVVFLNSYNYIPTSSIRCLGLYYCSWDFEQNSEVHVYDLTDKSRPRLEQNISVKGEYYDARMIDNYVYFISQYNLNYEELDLPVYVVNGVEKVIPTEDIYYFNYDDKAYYMTLISSLNIKNGEFSTKSYVTGYSASVYASEDNIYVTNNEYMNNEEYQKELIKKAVIPIVPDFEKQKINEILNSNSYEYSKWKKIGIIVEEYYNSLSENEKVSFNQTLFDNLNTIKAELEKEREKTVINKFSIKDGKIEYQASGKVPGRILNQFSMDEHEGYFRIATSIGNNGWWGWRFGVQNSTNGVYVLDSSMNIIGKVEGLASGERIYSTRFLGDKLFMVTFRRIDPFFVVDLSNPKNPFVLGYLKIPGTSQYLHLYDKNHIIGIGNDADEEGRIKGVKISLFDVSDYSNPKETARYIIGDRRSSSPVFYDHKALLFDKESNLMVFPVLVYEKRQNNEDESTWWAYGEAVFQGAYVFAISPNGIELKGKITHFAPYVPVYPAASSEPVGAIRKDSSGISYTKIANDTWKPNKGFDGHYFSDSIIDKLPGGVDYHPYFYDERYTIIRSLFMDNSLYTISNSFVKANDLKTLQEQKAVDLRYIESEISVISK